MDKPNESLDKIAELERELSLPKGFFLSLLDENDWSFLIKLHVLIDAAVAHLLIHHPGMHTLKPVIHRLELSDITKGKIAFADALDALGSIERRFVRAISELRNRLVHDISNVTFDLDEYVKSLDKNQRKQFLIAFGLGEDLEAELEFENGTKVTRRQFITENPKLNMWLSSLLLLELIYVKKENLELQKELETLEKNIYKNMIVMDKIKKRNKK